MRITIVDDEINSIKVTRSHLKQYDENINIVGEYTNPMEAIKLFETMKPNVLLLDIEMPEMNGFEMLEKVPLDGVNVIFITAYDQYAIRAIKCSAIDYILKPFSFHELEDALNKTKEILKNDHFRIDAINQESSLEKPKFIVIRGVHEYNKINLQDIIYAEGQRGGYTAFYMSNGTKLTASKPLAYYQDILDVKLFEKIHKSHIINVSRMKSLDLDNLQVTMENGVALDIAIRRKTNFINRIRT